MKVLLSLTVFCSILALCYSFEPFCAVQQLEPEIKDGKVVIPNECVDPFAGTKHPIGSAWNTSHCIACQCEKQGRICCTRYGGVEFQKGCIAVLDPETCKYKFYRLDNSTEPCES